MPEYLCAIAICLADWGAASSHMCYRTRTMWISNEPDRQFTTVDTYDLAPVRLPFYNIPLRVFGDMFHLIAGLRYIPMLLLMWVSYGWQWEWWLGTAGAVWIGWQVLKRIHGKSHWGWGPWERWMK